MNKWLSDDEIEKGVYGIAGLSSIPDQAKEANRLRAKIKDLKEWLQETEQYYNEKAEATRSPEEANSWSGRADACEDFIDDLAKLLEGE